MTFLKLWDGTRNTCTSTNWKPTRVSWTTNCMLSLGLTSYDMELGFSDLFASCDMELETHDGLKWCSEWKEWGHFCDSKSKN